MINHLCYYETTSAVVCRLRMTYVPKSILTRMYSYFNKELLNNCCFHFILQINTYPGFYKANKKIHNY